MIKRTSQSARRSDGRTASTGGSRRAAADDDPKKPANVSGRKKGRGGGTELMIAAGVIVFLGLIALVLHSQRKGEKEQADRDIAAAEKSFNANMQAGFSALGRAENAGFAFVTGKDTKLSDDQLFGPFRTDDRVYNVIYDRNFKDERIPFRSDQKAMSEARLRVERMDTIGREENGAKCCYGFADNRSQPIVIAAKSFKAADGDAVNLGGTITVVVKVETDRKFERAKQPKASAEK